MKADPLIMGVWCHDYVRRVGRYALDALPCSFAPYAKATRSFTRCAYDLWGVLLSSARWTGHARNRLSHRQVLVKSGTIAAHAIPLAGDN